MPNARQRASAATTETKALLPEIPARSGTVPTSYLWEHAQPLPPLPVEKQLRLRTAVIGDEAFGVAVDWQNYAFPHNTSQNTSSSTFPPPSYGEAQLAADNSGTILCGQRAPPVFYRSILHCEPTNRVLVLNTANERKPGGDWDGGITQEEGFSRRSNLVQALMSTDLRSSTDSYYPIPQMGAIYSPNVVVFREGYRGEYRIWDDRNWTTISVVSAAPVKRPKTDGNGQRYAFDIERELQKDKMKTVLRVAALNGHTNLVLGGFGSGGSEGSGGSVYRNPIKEVCALWKDLLYNDPEFVGWFANILFALGDGGGGWQNLEEDTQKSMVVFREYFGI